MSTRAEETSGLGSWEAIGSFIQWLFFFDNTITTTVKITSKDKIITDGYPVMVYLDPVIAESISIAPNNPITSSNMNRNADISPRAISEDEGISEVIITKVGIRANVRPISVAAKEMT